jgi:hypothetical protein
MMRTAALLLLLAGAACASNPAGPAKNESEGTTSQQGKDEATRALTQDECKALGQSILDACHGTNTRSAQFEGWCSDVIHGVDTGTWIADCEKHMKYMDAVCITSNTSIRAMMDCDSAVSR